MDGISRLLFDRQLASHKQVINADTSVPEEKKIELYEKVKSIMSGEGKGKEWVNESGKLRAILNPGDKHYNQSFYPESHYSDLRFGNELALAAYLVLDKR